MQIRTIILLLSFIGAALTALVVGFLSNERETVQSNADAEVRWEIYSESLQRHIKAELEKLEVFSVNGERGIFGGRKTPSR